MPLFAWAGAAAAALVATALLMFKGGMVERRAAPDATPSGGDASGQGIPGLGDDQEDPFKRYPRPRDAGAGPKPTQTDTVQLANDTWAPADSGTAVTYTSPGDNPAPAPYVSPGGYGVHDPGAPAPVGTGTHTPGTPAPAGAGTHTPGAPPPIYTPPPPPMPAGYGTKYV